MLCSCIVNHYYLVDDEYITGLCVGVHIWGRKWVINDFLEKNPKDDGTEVYSTRRSPKQADVQKARAAGG